MIELGSFQIDRSMRALRRNGRLVPLGSRAFDILAAIATADGRLVTKEALFKAVWPHTVVDENSLHVALSALRKILGPERDLIVNVPGLGYRLRKRAPAARGAEAAGRAIDANCLAPPRCGLLGRAAQVQSIRAMLPRTHVLTLVGAGGIGKTSLAIEAARHAAADFTEPVCFVELAALTTRDCVLDAIVASLGLPIGGPPFDVGHVAAALGGKRRLLVLDNAEHVIGDVAHTVDALLAYDDTLRVLVTSREPLRIRVETVLRVDPLDLPPPHSTDAQILQSSAVDLFLLRASTLQAAVSMDSATIQLAGEICRRLDGIPLAIELAAARVFALGVDGVHRLLDDRMAMLGGGYRNALPRHWTLRATFDWSFAILDMPSQLIFRRLAVFSGSFSFEALCAVVCDETYSVMDAINGVTELVAKSLVSVELVGSVARYRLSESARAYAMEKLCTEGEHQQIASRHECYLSSLDPRGTNDELERDLHSVTG
ncbi:ATP-binding protein [Paraburkholderia sp. BCC1884]|uniref:ATP-binding protein n=1 Tax=Paraburkholderia sp. BCC1884 TaxID=2562668 RepID=UPI001182E7D2|nr:winged helix-turn-helix domain-containing protein [Paraburkholderia sp. BCC1884]